MVVPVGTPGGHWGCGCAGFARAAMPAHNLGILAESTGRPTQLHQKLHRALAAAHDFLRGAVLGIRLGIYAVRSARHCRVVVLPANPQASSRPRVGYEDTRMCR